MYYTYCVKHNPTGYFYYGVKYSKNADPKKFWVPGGYYTSSKLVHLLIKEYGTTTFTPSIRKIFKCKFEAQRWEKRVIRKIIKHPKCLNKNIGGVIDSQKVADIAKIDFDGSGSSYDKRIKKAIQTMQIKDETGMTLYQKRGKKLSEFLKNNPEFLLKRAKNTAEFMNEIQENGKTRSQNFGDLIKGDNNPSKKKEVREKIRDSVNKYFKNETEEQKKYRSEKIKQSFKDNDIGKKHSEWMIENNPTTDSRWYNNGEKNIRIKNGDFIPEGFTLGRIQFIIKRVEKTCPHCGKTGKGPNMKRYHFDNCKDNDE